MGHRRLRSSVFAFGLAAMLGVLTAFSGFAATTNVTVTPASLSFASWYFYDDTGDVTSTSQLPGKYEFVTGPASPPAGIGSVRFQTTGSERWNIATSTYANTPLLNLAIKFNSFQPGLGQGANCAAASAECAVYLNFDVDFGTGLPGYQRRLVYVPGVNGAVAFDTWQEWDATASGALWTWSGYIANGNKWPDNDPNQYRTWQSLLAAFPAAHVNENAGSSQLLFRAGDPHPAGFIGYVDKVTIGVGSNTTVFDFEPFAAAQDKDDCKNGGWQNLRRADGTPFKNQGDCVSYTNSAT
jgi:hypothetical protein